MDERAPLSTYLRRNVLKATAAVGASIVLIGKAVATERVNAAEERHNEPVRNDEKGSTMPLARIDLNKGAPVERIRVVSQAIYGAMIEIANVPPHDKFMVFTRHATDEIVYPEEGYLGLTYTRDLIIIQITWVSGRSTDVKRRFFHRIADEIHEKAGVRKEDVWISLVDAGREDWSFGNGEMQYGPK
jgi:4-oxalocrotonate tautomerase